VRTHQTIPATVVLLATGLLGAPATAATPDDLRPSAAAPAARPVTLGGVRVRLAPGTRQVVTVNATSGHDAVVALWSNRTGRWERQVRSRAGRIGYGGLVPGRQRRQGTGTTPLGTYPITETFGNGPAPRGTRLPFHRVREGDYWVQDNRSRFYNDRRHVSRGGFRPHTSEHLPDYGAQYRWSLVIDFNRPDPVRHRGAGIFLHVNGPGATAGCVSAPRRFVKQVMRRLRPGSEPVIAIGR
jgi:L,D-peptidoglycan transpeptidase YkuD (ErfK/YbiS/YcfS/YnhG family)